MKRLLALLLAVCLLLAGCEAVSSERETGEQQNYETLVLVLPNGGKDLERIERVQAQMSAVLEERLGIHVKLLTLSSSSFSSYHQETQKIFAGTQQADVMLCMGTYVENWLCGNLLPLDDLLAQYGQGVVSAVEEDVIRGCAIDTAIYGVPNLRNYAISTDTYCLNAALLERNGFSIDEIQTMEDLEQVFSVIHENEPEVVILSTNLQSIAANRRYLNPQTPLVSALDEERDCYVNYFATEEYRSLLYQIRNWYTKGYVGFYSEAGEIKAAPGIVFAEARPGKPGVAEEVSRQRGEAYQDVCFGKNIISPDVYTAILYTITKNTISAEQSMMLLNELYQNAELNELLLELLPQWMLPNMFLTDVDEGYPQDLWEQTQRFKQEAELAPDVGFAFNPAAVMREYLEVCQIYERYRPILENGIVDPDEGLERMLAQLKTAGIDELLAEQNRQYAQWKGRQT